MTEPGVKMFPRGKEMAAVDGLGSGLNSLLELMETWWAAWPLKLTLVHFNATAPSRYPFPEMGCYGFVFIHPWAACGDKNCYFRVSFRAHCGPFRPQTNPELVNF